MKRTINFYDFERTFKDYNRENQFTYGGLKVLFDYLEEYEESCDAEIELDVIALCCEYSEDTWKDIADNYSIELDDDLDDGEKELEVLDYLNYHTSVCGVTDSGTIVYAVF